MAPRADGDGERGPRRHTTVRGPFLAVPALGVGWGFTGQVEIQGRGEARQECGSPPPPSAGTETHGRSWGQRKGPGACGSLGRGSGDLDLRLSLPEPWEWGPRDLPGKDGFPRIR